MLIQTIAFCVAINYKVAFKQETGNWRRKLHDRKSIITTKNKQKLIENLFFSSMIFIKQLPFELKVDKKMLLESNDALSKKNCRIKL
jgi:hypothetical protein